MTGEDPAPVPQGMEYAFREERCELRSPGSSRVVLDPVSLPPDWEGVGGSGGCGLGHISAQSTYMESQVHIL